MSGKMKDKELNRELMFLDGYAPGPTRAIRSHIAALTAERDEAQEGLRSMTTERDTTATHLKMAYRQIAESARLLDLEVMPDGWGLHAAAQKVLAECDVLRERVKALEEENEARCAEMNAIRQRAGDTKALVEAHQSGMGCASVARYILGEDAPAQGCSNCEGVQPETCAAHPAEPTTAEAFATVRVVLHPLQHDGAPVPSPRADAALSLLERRMGAVASAFAEFDKACRAAGGVKGLSMGEEEALNRLRAALTDAPPVFTLEEVRAAGDDVADDVEPGPVALTDDAAEAYASGWARGARTVADRLPTMRR